MTDVLIGVDTLRRRLDSGERTVLLDVRWALGNPHGRDDYLREHLPDAVYVDLETELAAPASAEAGRHPLPDVADLQAAARRWGVRAGDTCVVYDDAGGTSAGRAWWLLRWAGLSDVRILDGGLPAWRAAGLPVERGEVVPEPGDVELTSGGMPVIGPEDAGEHSGHGVLLDARAGERYRGEAEPVDPRAGHIPGARSAPTTGNLDEAHHFLDAEQLRRRFAELGADGSRPVAVYCGSGVTAAHEVAALAAAGIDAALYPGSWSQWSADPRRPVATGPDPAGGAG
ncbi:thiosulfate/3-mercaptopyruvate sulfurtransferase [Haloactinopolyspora alba]|uniref:Thiosulfate/3-mercaptopyruvate sulfurtransferase n=1 Tax=Haloactinopolyspora alba TaxID=648780 RepID=A0A2P8E6U2_9ACTN|nr:sulfurtransferase [Haloactinopolyspora alba]PSL05202.1 thiosulfate/3-mercaptopyruvate sulfurtransferase [Haloactinopolyspora alba]